MSSSRSACSKSQFRKSAKKKYVHDHKHRMVLDFVIASSTISGRGVFAMKDIRKGATVFRCRGRVVAATEDPPNTMYIFHNRWRNVFVDAQNDCSNFLREVGTDKRGRVLYEYVNVDPDNPEHPTIARYANHLPSKLANCRATAGGLIVTKRRILKGEELTFTYGRSTRLRCKKQGLPLDV